MFGWATGIVVVGLFYAASGPASHSGQAYDEAVCFKGEGAERQAACSRLIDNAKVDEVTRGRAYAFRCSEYVRQRRMDLAQKDCEAARQLAPREPHSHFASFTASFYSGDKEGAEGHLMVYRDLLEQVRVSDELEMKRLREVGEARELSGLKEVCDPDNTRQPSHEVLSTCQAIEDLASIGERDRALASAISCHVQVRLKRFEMAEEGCRRAFRGSSTPALSYFARGHLRLSMQEFEGAVADFNQAEKLGGLSTNISRLLEGYRAVASLAAAEAAIERLRQSGKVVAVKMLAAEAAVVDAYEKYLEVAERPGMLKNPELHASLDGLPGSRKRVQGSGGADGTLSKGTSSGSSSTGALVEQPQSNPDPLEYDVCWAEQMSVSRERACLRRALRGSPMRQDLLIRLANSHARSGMHEVAVRYWSAVIAAAPKEPEFLVARCRQRLAWGRELREALKDCGKAIDLSPDNHVALELRGAVHLRFRNIDAAVADYNAALAVHPACIRCQQGLEFARLELKKRSVMAEDPAKAKLIDTTVDPKYWDPFVDR